MMLVCTTLHSLFFISSLALLGFVAMIEELLLALICFSGYLTLYDWTVSLYLVLVAISTLVNMISFFSYKQLAFLAYLSGLIFNFIAFVLVLRAYWRFEQAGGNIHSSWKTGNEVGNMLDGTDMERGDRGRQLNQPLLLEVGEGSRKTRRTRPEEYNSQSGRSEGGASNLDVDFEVLSKNSR